jgi:NADPH:quinone reductase
VFASHAELMAVPVASLRRKPKRPSLEQAAAVGVTYLAAWLCVVEYAQLASDETLLVIGAGGGVRFPAAARAERHPMRIGGDDDLVVPDRPTRGETRGGELPRHAPSIPFHEPS